jgi:hypothetical protein
VFSIGIGISQRCQTFGHNHRSPILVAFAGLLSGRALSKPDLFNQLWWLCI